MGSYDDTGLLSVSGLLSVVEASCCACFVLCGPFDVAQGSYDELRDPGCGMGSYDDTGLLSVSGLLSVVEASWCACFALCGPFDVAQGSWKNHFWDSFDAFFLLKSHVPTIIAIPPVIMRKHRICPVLMFSREVFV